jgi:hypothetical protein
MDECLGFLACFGNRKRMLLPFQKEKLRLRHRKNWKVHWMNSCTLFALKFFYGITETNSSLEVSFRHQKMGKKFTQELWNVLVYNMLSGF